MFKDFFVNTPHVVTSFLCGDHQGLRGLAPALPRLRFDAEHVDGLRPEAVHRVLASAGDQHVHRGGVAIGGVEVVRDLVGWRDVGEQTISLRGVVRKKKNPSVVAFF